MGDAQVFDKAWLMRMLQRVTATASEDVLYNFNLGYTGRVEDREGLECTYHTLGFTDLCYVGLCLYPGRLEDRKKYAPLRLSDGNSPDLKSNATISLHCRIKSSQQLSESRGAEEPNSPLSEASLDETESDREAKQLGPPTSSNQRYHMLLSRGLDLGHLYTKERHGSDKWEFSGYSVLLALDREKCGEFWVVAIPKLADPDYLSDDDEEIERYRDYAGDRLQCARRLGFQDAFNYGRLNFEKSIERTEVELDNVGSSKFFLSKGACLP